MSMPKFRARPRRAGLLVRELGWDKMPAAGADGRCPWLRGGQRLRRKIALQDPLSSRHARLVRLLAVKVDPRLRGRLELLLGEVLRGVAPPKAFKGHM